MTQTPIKPAPSESSDVEPVTPRRDELVAVRRLLLVIALLLGATAMYLASAVFIPLATALLVSLLFKPVIRRAEDWGVPPTLSAIAIVGTLLALLFAAVMVGSQSARTWMDDLPRTTQELETRFRDVRERVRAMNEATDKLSALASGASPDAVAEGEAPPVTEEKPVPVEVKASGFPGVVLDTTSRFLAGLTITLVMSFFMLASGDLLLRQLVQALPALRQKRNAVEAWRDLEDHVSAYLVTVTVINAGLGVAVWAVLSLIGLPSALWWGVAAALANFVPYVGALLVAVGVFLAGALAFESLWPAAGAAAAFVALTSLEGYFVTPVILGRRLSLNPLILFVWLVMWGWMWGVAGALLAVPMLVCFKIVCEHVEGWDVLADVLSGSVRRAGAGRGEAEAGNAKPQA